jgi:hypothetical protein
MMSRRLLSAKREGDHEEPAESRTKRPKAEDDEDAAAAGAIIDSLVANSGGDAAVVTVSSPRGEDDDSDGAEIEGLEGTRGRARTLPEPWPRHEATSTLAATRSRALRRMRVGTWFAFAPDYQHVLAKVGEDDPALLIMWGGANVRRTIAAFNAALAAGGAGPVVPQWMAPPAGTPYDEDIFVHKILTHMKKNVGNGGGRVIGNALIAPNDLHGWTGLIQELCIIGIDPFFIAHVVCSIGQVYCLADKKQKTTAVVSPVHVPRPHGVGVFQ